VWPRFTALTAFGPKQGDWVPFRFLAASIVAMDEALAARERLCETKRIAAADRVIMRG
jgi:hypothetical protein